MNKKQRFSGQSIIEFMLIFPIAFFLITGLLDLGRGIFYYSSLSNAVREGARYTTTHRDLSDDEIKDKVLEFAFALHNTVKPLQRENIVITYPEIVNEKKITVSISATYAFDPVTPGLGLFWGGSDGILLAAQSTMRLSGAAR
jgi:Flp pilus assembly protein TadG